MKPCLGFSVELFMSSLTQKFPTDRFLSVAHSTAGQVGISEQSSSLRNWCFGKLEALPHNFIYERIDKNLMYEQKNTYKHMHIFINKNISMCLYIKIQILQLFPPAIMTQRICRGCKRCFSRFIYLLGSSFCVVFFSFSVPSPFPLPPSDRSCLEVK